MSLELPALAAHGAAPRSATTSVRSRATKKQIADLGSSLDSPINGSTLEVKTRAPNGVTFRTLGLRDNASNNISGEIETKFDNKKNGVTVTNAWTTANIIRNHVELENHVAKGLKFEAISQLQLEKQTKNIVLASIYKQPGVHTRQHLDLFKVCRRSRSEETLKFGRLTKLPSLCASRVFLLSGPSRYRRWCCWP